ncbi:MAG: nucleotidyltransferase domain-containing protein [Bacteroidia bacterium]
MKEDLHTIPLFLRQHLPAIRALCVRHKVKQLWVFGSVLRGDFGADSDVDFLYEMDDANIAENESYECFWGFFDVLQKLLRREIDMVWYHGIKNPYFREEVDETKVLIYDQRKPL